MATQIQRIQASSPLFCKYLSYWSFQDDFRCLTRKFITACLHGRDICHPTHLSSADLKTLIWTAFEMKQCPIDMLKGRHLTMLMRKPSFKHQVSFHKAALALGANLTLVVDEKSCHTETAKVTGKALGSMSDAIIVSDLTQEAVQEVADGARVPVISCSSDIFSMTETLAHFMTMMEHMGPLRRRCVAWVGPLNNHCLSFLYLAPKLNLNFRAFCTDQLDLNSNRDNWEQGVRENRGQAEFHECSSLEDAVYRSDAIITSSHGMTECKITSEILEEAALEWYFIHALPRTSIEVTDEVFNHKNNLTWESLSNTKYIAMALMVQVLKEYQPTSQMPDFEGEP